MKKKIFICLVIIISFILLILGYRFIKYYDFFGKFYSESGGYYQFNLFSWQTSDDGSEEQKCSLWNCNIDSGNIYYKKENKLYMKNGNYKYISDKFKLEKKDGKIYLNFYDSNDKLLESYIKK